MCASRGFRASERPLGSTANLVDVFTWQTPTLQRQLKLLFVWRADKLTGMEATCFTASQEIHRIS